MIRLAGLVLAEAVALTPPKPRPTGASLARHKSDQVVGTPQTFLDAIVRRFGPLAWDLAATAENAKAPMYWTPAQDSLGQHWSAHKGNAFLNPPFGNIAPWAAKCVLSAGGGVRIYLLVPASVGSIWWAASVDGKAGVLLLRPRLRFEGHVHSFPRDLALCVYGAGAAGYECWKWDAT
jgi:phage N-6-adenine-methyltransferase